eukprot:Sspe_Gene.145::Locus_46_Transcript_1_2_Confidence_0.667_Length_1879::g.145::m.145
MDLNVGMSKVSSSDRIAKCRSSVAPSTCFDIRDTSLLRETMAGIERRMCWPTRKWATEGSLARRWMKSVAELQTACPARFVSTSSHFSSLSRLGFDVARFLVGSGEAEKEPANITSSFPPPSPCSWGGLPEARPHPSSPHPPTCTPSHPPTAVTPDTVRYVHGARARRVAREGQTIRHPAAMPRDRCVSSRRHGLDGGRFRMRLTVAHRPPEEVDAFVFTSDFSTATTSFFFSCPRTSDKAFVNLSMSDRVLCGAKLMRRDDGTPSRRWRGWQQWCPARTLKPEAPNRVAVSSAEHDVWLKAMTLPSLGRSFTPGIFASCRLA